MTKQIIKTGILGGRGATLNVELGFVPDVVFLYNATDGDIITMAFLEWAIAFTSGGTSEIAAGAKIRGATSRAIADVESVHLTSGSWAGGDAAGFLKLVEGSLVGTFGAENIVVTNLASGVVGTDDATVTANAVDNCAITTAAASASGTSAISRYEGVAASNAKGFTVGSVIAEAAKRLRYIAIRQDF